MRPSTWALPSGGGRWHDRAASKEGDPEMVRHEVQWSDEVDDVFRGDLTAAAAYVTSGGGAVVSTVAPLGVDWCKAGGIGFTTSLGFAKKLERIIADPRVALAYHTREHGFSTSSAFVLAQGSASVLVVAWHRTAQRIRVGMRPG